MNGRHIASVAATAAALLWGNAALAASATCPNPTVSGLYSMTLTTTTAGVTCWDYGTTTDSTGNPAVVVASPVVLDDKILQLPTGTSTTDSLAGYLSGTINSGTNGTLTVTTAYAGPAYLLFKFGSGQTGNYWWYAFELSSLSVGDQFAWSATNQQALSHAELFLGTPSSSSSSSSGDIPSSSSGTPVPEPASSMVLLGLGLLGLGFARRVRHSA